MPSPRRCTSSNSVSTSGAARGLQSEVQPERSSTSTWFCAAAGTSEGGGKTQNTPPTAHHLRHRWWCAAAKSSHGRSAPAAVPSCVDSCCLRLSRTQPASLHRRWFEARARRSAAATLCHIGGWAQHPATDGALSDHRRCITHLIMCSLRYVVAAGKRLLSPQGDVTRPMMEMVRSPSVPTPCVVLP